MKTITILLSLLGLFSARHLQDKDHHRHPTLKRLRKKITCDEMDDIQSKADSMRQQMATQSETVQELKSKYGQDVASLKEKSNVIEEIKKAVEQVKTASSHLDSLKSKAEQVAINANALEELGKNIAGIQEKAKESQALQQKERELSKQADPAISELDALVAKSLEESGAIERLESGLKAVDTIASGMAEQEKKATSLLDKLRHCKTHETMIKAMRKKAEDCKQHQAPLQGLNGQLEDLLRVSKELKSLEKSLNEAMDRHNPPVKQTQPEKGLLNVLNEAVVKGVYDKDMQVSTKDEQFQKYFQNSLSPSSDKNGATKFLQSENPDGYRCIGAMGSAGEPSNAVIDLHFSYSLKECMVFVQEGLANKVQLSYLSGASFDPSKQQQWHKLGDDGLNNPQHNTDPTKVLMSKRVAVGKSVRYLKVQFSGEQKVQAIAGIKCFL